MRKLNNKSGLWLLVLVLLLAMLAACEEETPTSGRVQGGDSDTTDSTIDDSGGDLDTSGEAPPNCGDGYLDDDEACDDKNTESGDGCSANCLYVAEGYSCNPPGAPCRLVAKCGDGNVSTPELCDDDNLDEGDGCNSRCQVEIGYKCDGQPSVCTETICGDSKIEGAEGCDDGNDIPFDGCDARCQLEPDCSSGACASSCGDGLVLGEECDDGNNLNGDGCSADCEIEPGFTCPQEGCVDEENCTLKVAAVYRDFSKSHPDMYEDPKVCDKGEGAIPGLVEDTLDADWHPVKSSLATSRGCYGSFSDWYTIAPTKVGEVVLYPDGSGNFVNRYGENGEQWIAPGDNNGDIICTSDDCMSCYYSGEQCEKIAYDGDPMFFPIDDVDGAELFPAKIPGQYGYSDCPDETKLFPDAPDHNFYFTTEVTYWFKFDAANPATLNFTGDDDVWVFVNGQLAVDLGGTHPPADGSVTISSSNDFGMKDGNVYRINIFHAERREEGSTFKLTLGGFNTARSACAAYCGDGIVGLGEECDDEVNDGGYGECGEGCKLDEYCGDGIVQEKYGEDCDDGNFKDGDDCPSSCREIIIG